MIHREKQMRFLWNEWTTLWSRHKTGIKLHNGNLSVHVHTQYGPKVQFFEYQSVYIDLLNQQTNEITGNPLDENDAQCEKNG